MSACDSCARCTAYVGGCQRTQCLQAVLCEPCDDAVNGAMSLANLRRAAAKVGGA